MIKLSANLSMLFTEDAFLRRFKRAADNGFAAVEFLFPYEYKTEEIQEKLKQFNLKIVLHNLPAGNWEGVREVLLAIQIALKSLKKA